MPWTRFSVDSYNNSVSRISSRCVIAGRNQRRDCQRRGCRRAWTQAMMVTRCGALQTESFALRLIPSEGRIDIGFGRLPTRKRGISYA